MKRLLRTIRSFGRSSLQFKCLVLWLGLVSGAAIVSACDDDQNRRPRACINGEDCAWTVIEANHSGTLGCAIRSEGTLWCWGYLRQTNNPGLSVWYPGFVQILIPAEIDDVSIGIDTICALDRRGRVWCWGDNYWGMVGDGSTEFRPEPVEVQGIGPAEKIEVGSGEVCTLLDDRSVWCWGFDVGGSSTDGFESTPHKKIGLEDISDISIGNSHGCVLHTQGRVSCWGRNDYFQLGMPDKELSVSTFDHPLVVNGTVKAIDLDCGSNHACSVVDNGTVWCWGANYEHQLGLPVSTDGTHIPGQVAALVDIERVYAGSFNTCASNHDGDLFCWGDNSYGQIGRPPFEQALADIPGSDQARLV